MGAEYWDKTPGSELGGEGTSYTLATPASTEVGDLVIFELFVTTEAPVTLSGSSISGGVVRQEKDGGLSRVLAYGVATESDKHDLTLSWPGAAYRIGDLVTVRGADVEDPIAAYEYKHQESAETTMRWLSATAQTAGSLSMLFGLSSSLPGSAPSGYTKQLENHFDYLATKQVGAGATGEETASISSDSYDTWHLVVNPVNEWRGDQLAKFELQEKEVDRITESTDPKAPGTVDDVTFRFENRDGDYLSPVEEEEEPPVTRAEILSADSFATATEVTRWYRWQTRFGDDYDTRHEGEFRVITQFRLDDESESIFEIFTEGTNIRFFSLTGTVIGTVELGEWYDWILEAVWSESEERAVQRLYLNDVLVAESNEVLPEGVGIYMKWGYYKNANVPGGTIYHGGIVAAETKAGLGPT